MHNLSINLVVFASIASFNPSTASFLALVLALGLSRDTIVHLPFVLQKIRFRLRCKYETPMPDSSDFTTIFAAAITTPEALQEAVNGQPAYWAKHLRATQRACNKAAADNETLQSRLHALERVDELLSASQQSIENLNNLLQQSVSHPDPDRFYGDRDKVDIFVTQLRIKLRVNSDHFIRQGTDTEQNKLFYTVSRLGGDAFTHIRSYLEYDQITLPNVARMIEILEARFGEVDPVGTAKDGIFRLYQTNKDLDTFLNTFLLLAKKAKLDDGRALDMLYEKLSNEFKLRLVTLPKQTTLDDLVKQLRDLDSRLKLYNKHKPAYRS